MQISFVLQKQSAERELHCSGVYVMHVEARAGEACAAAAGETLTGSAASICAALLLLMRAGFSMLGRRAAPCSQISPDSAFTVDTTKAIAFLPLRATLRRALKG